MSANPPSPRSALVTAATAVIIHSLLGLALLCGMLWFVPKYKRLFREYQMELGYPTKVVIDIADWFGTYWYVLILVALPILALDGAIVFWCASRNSTRVLGGLWIFLWILVWLLFTGLAALIVWLEYLRLQEALSR
jgi:type II secretory pathway component PulF